MGITCVVFVVVVMSGGLLTGGADIVSNGYKGVSISFARNVRQEHFNFEKLKEVLRKSSEFLYHSTRHRSYFSEFVLTLPPSWKNDLCESPAIETPRTVDIYITDSNTDTLHAQHSKGCQSKGELIYMNLNWLKGDINELAREFVQQWAVFRYGVFEETPDVQGSCFHHDAKTISPTGCYNVDLKQEKSETSEDGLEHCHIEEGFYGRGDLSSSLMFATNTTAILNFCDGTQEFPHNPVMATRHNNLCNGRSTWHIISNSEDFKYGRNPPMINIPQIETSFKCFQEPSIQLTLAVQNSSIDDVSKIVEDMRYSLLRFLQYDVPKENARANLVTFSNASYTEMAAIQSVDLEDTSSLLTLLTATIRTVNKVTDACLVCGLQKSLSASRSTSHPSPTVALIAFQSSTKVARTPDLVEEILKFTTERLFILFIRDTTDDVLPSELLKAVQKTGGQVFSLTQRALLIRDKLNVALINTVQSPLHLEDRTVVIHEAAHENVTSDITDVYITEGGLAGTLVYTLQCNDSSLLPLGTTCTDKAYTCGAVSELDLENEPKTWTQKYKYLGGIHPVTCSSLVTLQLSDNSSYPITLRGWLSSYLIQPGRDSLVIYAELVEKLITQFRVTATIEGLSSKNSFSETLELFDNGNGDPDVRKGDNIYSRYFTQFTKKGTYLVALNAHSKTHSFSRTTIIGSFSVTEDPPLFDIYPPNRIGDLSVISVDHENSTVTLQWTAPGDDFDYGSATNYSIKFSKFWPELLLDLSFDSNQNLFVFEGNDTVPSVSGTTECKTLQLPIDEEESMYYIVMRAIDKADNRGPISNIVQVSLQSSTRVIASSSSTSTGIIITASTIPPTATEIGNSTANSTLNDTETATSSTSTADEEFTSSTDSTSTSDNCLDKDRVILISASAGSGILVIIIVINIIVCCCCFKKRIKDPKTLSRKASLRPPYNLNIAYRKDELETNVDSEDDHVPVMNPLTNHNKHTSPQSSTSRQENEFYNYGSSTNSSQQQMNQLHDAGTEQNDFQVVKAMPAYVSPPSVAYSSHDSIDSIQFKPHIAQPQKSQQMGKHKDDSIVYSLGLV